MHKYMLNITFLYKILVCSKFDWSFKKPQLYSSADYLGYCQ